MDHELMKKIIDGEPDPMPEKLNPDRESYLTGQGQAWETELGLRQLRSWAEAGLSYIQIANNVGVTRATFSRWRKESPLLQRALDIGRQTADIQVANALFENAVGAVTKERRVETKTDADGQVSTREVEVETKHRGDTAAQLFWLKNRMPEDWRERQEALGGTANLSETNAEIAKYLYVVDVTEDSKEEGSDE